MRYIGLILLILSSLACNLARTTPTPEPNLEPPPTAEVTESVSFLATATPIIVGRPTLLPLPGLPVIAPPVTSVPNLGALCEVYSTYSGARADNKLSMRSAPSTTAPQVFRVPNNIQVLRVPNSQEVEAEGYHWLNVIYTDTPQMRYIGWIARDSFEVNGDRDPSVATLRAEGTQSPC